MLIYAQDQFGYVSDDMIGEVARRLAEVLQVTETLAYYSMLRRRPAEKYHVQSARMSPACFAAGNNLYDFIRENSKSAQMKSPETAFFRWKKSNVWERARAHRQCR